MPAFNSAIQEVSNDVENWHFIAYDQLHQELIPDSEKTSLGLIFIETTWKANQLPYHKQKLALLLSNQRHFALEMQSLGYPIKYIFSTKGYGQILETLSQELGQITVSKPAELTLRRSLEELQKSEKVVFLEHKGWLTTSEEFLSIMGDKPPWRMDKFYRNIRKSRGIMLDENSKPLGGAWSLDDQNRLPWDNAVELPKNPIFEPDEITLEVIDMVNSKFSHPPGKINPNNYQPQIEMLLFFGSGLNPL